MSISLAITLILGFILVYIFLVEIYSILFRITGLTTIKARFQAISLLTNSGYTTSESEIITTNKLRRNIAIASMVTGYSFSVIIVSLVFNLITRLSAQSWQENYETILIILAAFAGVLIFFKLPFIKKPVEKGIEKIARKIMKKGIKENVITLLDIYDKDVIAEVAINKVPQIIQNKKLMEINVRDLYNINILMLKKNGVAEVVTKETILQENDDIVVFGPLQSIRKLFMGKEELDEKDKKEPQPSGEDD